MAASIHHHSLAGKRVVCVMSGGNLNLPTLGRILVSEPASAVASRS
jgi:threonine dehydratase